MKRLFVIVVALVMVTLNVYAFDSIEKGSSGDNVKDVQEMLISLGYLSGQADGQFGGMTEDAVKKYQTENGIEATGIVDDATYNELLTSMQEYASENAPEGMIIDEEKWEAWEPEGVCSVSSFMGVGDEAGFTFSVPFGQGDSAHKTVSFTFQENGELADTLENVEMYYGVNDDSHVEYTGLWTADENIFKSEKFKEACIRLMLGYNSHYDSDTRSVVLNLTRERAEEIVSFCLDNNIEHCLVDGMRIRSLRNPEDNYYSFHMEYSK